MLGVLVLAWGGLRFATWASPVPEGYGLDQAPAGEVAADEAATLIDPRLYLRAPVAPDYDYAIPPAPTIAPAIEPVKGGWNDPASYGATRSISSSSQVGGSTGEQAAAEQARRSQMRMTAGHSLLMAAGFSNMQVPPEIAAFYESALADAEAAGRRGEQQHLARTNLPDAAPYAAAPTTNTSGSSRRRWSADGWLLWREDTTTPLTSGRPSYGRSQMGAVVRFELAPQSGHRPQAYLRGSAALQGASEQEVSAGLSARPIAQVPIRLAAEVRVSDRAVGNEVRPALFAVTELAPQQLPGGLQAEAYVQGGYVGGDFSTAFVDGQARVDGSLASVGDFDLRAGAAAWGGAQEDGERLDVGPTASVSFSLGDTRGRLAADYRFRVAGDAQPASGPALTLSAGF